MRRTLLSLLLLASLLACERREEPIEPQPEIQEPPQLAAKPLTVDEAVATATHYAAIFLGEGIKPAGVTPIFSRRTRGDNGERDTMLLAVHMAGGGLTFVDPRLAPQDAVLCVLPESDVVDSLPPPAQFLIEAISAKMPRWSIDPDGDGPIDWHPEPPPSTGGGGGGGGGGSSGPTDGAHFPPNGDVIPIDGYSPPDAGRVTRDTQIIRTYGPWLKTTWGQRTRNINKRCFWKGKPCPVGCIPLAIAQVLAYHRKPSHLPWDGILSEKLPPYAYVDLLADLLFTIGEKTDVTYHPDGSGASDRKINPTLKDYNLNCSSEEDFGPATVQDLIAGRPAIMCGYSTKNPKEGHAWVLNGYQSIYTRSDIYNSKGYRIDTEEKTISYVHVNMGWQGSGDGWYTSNLAYNPTWEYRCDMKVYRGITP